MSKSKGVISTVTLVFIFLLTVTLLFLTSSYLPFKNPFVSANFQEEIDYVIASTPYVPKTTKQIVTKAFRDSSDIESSKDNIEIVVTAGGMPTSSFTIVAQIDNKDASVAKVEAQLSGEVNLFGQKYLATLEIVEIGDDFYFKVNQAPDIGGYNLGALVGKWYALDLNKLSEEARFELENFGVVRGEALENLKDTLGYFQKEELFNQIVRLDDQRVAGSESFHFRLDVGQNTWREIVSTILPDSAARGETGDNDIIYEFWVDKDNFFVNKFAASSKSNNQEVKFSYEISEINRSRKIAAPTDFERLDSLNQLVARIEPPRRQLPRFGQSTTIVGGALDLYEWAANYFLGRLLPEPGKSQTLNIVASVLDLIRAILGAKGIL